MMVATTEIVVVLCLLSVMIVIGFLGWKLNS